MWAFLEQISSLVLGSLAFWLFLIPVVTFPAALTGLFAVVGPLVRGQGGDWLSLFWVAFRRSFVPSLVLGLLNLLLAGIIWVDIRFFWALGSPIGQVLAFIMGSLALLLLMVNLYAWVLLAWYPQPLKSLLRRAFLLAAAHPFPALGGWLGAALVLFVMVMLPGRLLFVLPLFGPGLAIAILAFAAWRVMRRYVDENEL